MDDSEAEARDGTLFEFTVIGRQVKVAAIDSATGVEVSLLAPAGTARSDLQRLALRKLRRRLAGM